MKYIKQFGIIMIISLIGEVLNFLIPLPVPASIYGLILMLLALKSGLIRLSSVRETGRFLIEVMPLMFIPPAVGLLDSWGELENIWVPVIIITVATTVLVMAVTGIVTQLVIRTGGNREVKDE